MSKALLIPEADFSVVAVDQVIILEDKPCTAVSLNPSELTFETCEESKQLTAVKTPADTTDSVIWSSSDENVATVSNDGHVTIHGIGTATITVTCGSATASLLITQASLKHSSDLLYAEAGRFPERTSATPPAVVKSTSASGNSCIAQINDGQSDLAVYPGNASFFEMIRVPYGATKVKLATDDDSSFSIYQTLIASTTERATFNNWTGPAYVNRIDGGNSATGVDVSYGQSVCFRIAGTISGHFTHVYFT